MHGRRLNATLTLTSTLPLYSLPHADRQSGRLTAEVICLKRNMKAAHRTPKFNLLSWHNKALKSIKMV